MPSRSGCSFISCPSRSAGLVNLPAGLVPYNIVRCRDAELILYPDANHGAYFQDAVSSRDD